jgi:hypothetical protein
VRIEASEPDQGTGNAHARAWTDLFGAILALAAAEVALILLAGSLGAATSGRSFPTFWSGGSGLMVDTRVGTSDLPGMALKSGG